MKNLIQVKPNYSAQSIIEITEEYVFQNTYCTGHIYLLKLIHCVALIHNSTVLTQESNLKFIEK